MNKDLVLRIRELNQSALRHIGTMKYDDTELFGKYTYYLCADVLRVIDRMNEKRKASYVEKLLRKIADAGGKPLHDQDICDTGMTTDDRGVTVCWIIRPLDKSLEAPSESPLDLSETTITVYITGELNYGKWARNTHWLSNTNAKSRGHYPF